MRNDINSLVDKLVLISNNIGSRIDGHVDHLEENEFLNDLWHWVNELIEFYGEEE